MIALDVSAFPKTQRRVLDRLGEELDGNALKVGDLLGNEVSLAERMAVSRNTIRAVVGALAKAGVVRQVPHRGIFLEKPFRLASPAAERAAGEVVFLRWCDSPMEGQLSEGIGEAARARGHRVRVLHARQDLDTLVDLIDHVPEGTTTVLVPVDHPRVLDALARAGARGARVLQLDRYLEGLDAPTVMFDHYAAAAAVVRHLLREHGRVVYFYGYDHPVSSRLRKQAWRDALLEYGFADLERYDVPGGADADAEQRPNAFHMERLRAFFPRVAEARPVFVGLDAQATANVCAVAGEHGLRVGRDVWVAGMDELPFCLRHDPPLTAARGDYGLLCAAAGELLAEWPKNERYCRLLPMPLAVRASSRKVAEGVREPQLEEVL